MTRAVPRLPAVALAGALLLFPAPAHAARFTERLELDWATVRDETEDFLRNLILGGVDSDGNGRLDEGERALGTNLRHTAAACALVGLACGLLGSFITLRRMALFGDMVGHAVLPGVAVGFILAGKKSTGWMLGGALLAGLVAAALTRAIRRNTRIKEDAALGISLSLFYALGIWLLSWITRVPALSVEASGLNRYLFGNPAVIRPEDLGALGGAACLVALAVGIGWKELVVCSFDPGFSSSIGIPQRVIDGVLIVLLTTVIVVSIKVLGVVLVAAMLVIPPATAYLLTDRLGRLAALSVVLGTLSGVGGLWLGFVLRVGAGPPIVILAFTALLLAFLLSPRYGILARRLRHFRRRRRTRRENLLAAAWRARERLGGADADGVPLSAIAEDRGETVETVRKLARAFRGSGQARVQDGRLVLTPRGERRALEVIRAHRLWELFLSREASLPPDHVHGGAEELEHVLDRESREELERLLRHPATDPHGSTIPSLSDTPSSREEPSGKETGER